MMYFQIVAVAAEAVLVAAVAFVVIRSAMSPGSSVPSDLARRAGDGVLHVAVFIFVTSAITKFAHVPLAVTEMTLLGLTGPKYLLVASIELTSGVLLLIGRLRSLALLFISAHVGGAICAHLIAGQYFAMVPSAIVLSLCWLGAFLRHPQMLWSLSDTSGLQPAPTKALLLEKGEFHQRSQKA